MLMRLPSGVASFFFNHPQVKVIFNPSFGRFFVFNYRVAKWCLLILQLNWRHMRRISSNFRFAPVTSSVQIE